MQIYCKFWWKIKIFNFFIFFTFFIFFSKNVKKFVRIFDLAITYRRTRDPRQINHSEKLSPNINSNRNLSGWSLIKNWHFKRKNINMLQALWMQTFLTPYYSSSRGWAILLYESLEWKIYLALNDFCWFILAFSIRFMKNQIFFIFFTFFIFFIFFGKCGKGCPHF